MFRKGRASPEGELINAIVKEAATPDQPNSEGAADADVPAEEDQAKEKGVGAIHGLGVANRGTKNS